MSAKITGYVLAALLVMVVAEPGQARSADVKYTSRLIRVLENGDNTVHPIWVGFADKGLTASETALALDALAAGMPAKVMARRAGSSTGAPLVDVSDLPLDAGYLQAVAATGAVGRKQSRWLNAASFDATADQIEAIAGLAFVTSIDLVAGGSGSRPEISAAPPAEAEDIIRAAGADKSLDGLAYGASLPGLEQINVIAAHAMGLSGKGVTIAILDTGFQLNHECLQDVDIIATWDFINGDEYVGPRKNDHRNQVLYGTAVLSTLAGYSPDNLIGTAYGASVILAKTEDLLDETPAEEDNWIAALEWAEGLGADIISSSLGYYNWYDFADLDGSTALITVAAELAAARGVCVVGSVGDQRGNQDWPHIIPPTDGRNVIAVGSVNLLGQTTPTSSAGPTADGRIKPDVVALGYGTSIAYSGVPDMYFYGYGSNYAVPLVAGVVALMLEQNPHLNPTSVLEALRETAGRATLPDNIYGWGVIDAVAAMNYGSPAIDHTPLTDTEGGTGAHIVTATVTSSGSLDESGMWVAWRIADQSWHMEPLVDAGEDVYTAAIPPQSRVGTQVEYYLIATDTNGMATRSPALAPRDVYTFRVGTDTTPPVLEHINIPDQVPATWPPTLIAFASDNLELDSVELMFNPNPGGDPGPFFMTEAGDHFEIDFPLDPMYVLPGMSFTYMLVARDKAAIPNQSISGPHNFSIVASKGSILVVDDRMGTKTAADNRRGDKALTTDPDKSVDDVATWIRDAGFDVDVLPAEQVNSGSFLPYDAVMVSSGGNYGPLNHSELRRTMVAWTEAGGRLVIEGGEVAYQAAGVFPGYPELVGTVIPIDSYQGEDAALLRVPSSLVNHPLLNRPHRITGPLVIDNSDGYDYSAADMVFASTDAVVALQCGYGTNRGGLVFRDDNTGPDSGQTVYLPFDLLRTPESDGRDLIDNVLTYLLYNEPPGTGVISGTVILAGRQDYSGVTVRNGTRQTTTTAADGSFSLTGLWGGDYKITADYEGFTSQTRTVTVLDDTETSGIGFYLLPVTGIQYSSNPDLPIPDNDPGGITDTIDIVNTGKLLGITVDVDISHFSVGQLVVTLTSPAGTSVTLRNRTGGTADDLVGNWPGSLFVDGPGKLTDFHEENPDGTWTIKVSDEALGALGTFNSWGLNLLVTDSGASAVEAGPGPVTRLVGNAPNPFNPRTVISFELARPGPVQMDIYDLRGRRVRQLANRNYETGRHEIVWDGRDDRGGETASGLYFFRMKTEDDVQTHKMLLVR